MEHVLLAFIYWQDAPSSESSCKGCLAFRLGSERNDRIGAPVGHAFDFSLFFCHLLPPLASTFTLPLDWTTGARQTVNKSLSVPLSRPPTSSLLSRLFSSFLCTLGNDDPSSIFLYVRHDDDAFTYSPPTPILYRRIRLQTVGSHMYFSKPAHRGRH